MPFDYEPDFRIRCEFGTPRWPVSLDATADGIYLRVELKSTNMVTDIDFDIEYPSERLVTLQNLEDMIKVLQETVTYVKGLENEE